MKIEEFKTDGSTLPKIIKHWNKDGVYDAGEKHDLNIFLYPEKRLSAYLHYLGDLNCMDVSWYKIWVLGFGLGFYELTPKKVQVYLNKKASSS